MIIFVDVILDCVITGGFGKVFKGLLGLASGGIVTGPTLAMVGEGNESEAVMPLSKLGNLMNNTFNAGAMASNGGGGNGEFILMVIQQTSMFVN